MSKLKRVMLSIGVCLVLLIGVIGCAAEQTTSNTFPTITKKPSVTSAIPKATSTIHIVPNPPTRTPTVTSTITATIDAYSFKTVTPEYVGRCPVDKQISGEEYLKIFSSYSDNDISDMMFMWETERSFLTLLNSYGKKAFDRMVTDSNYKFWRKINTRLVDLTGDGVNEFIIIWTRLGVYGCKDDQYVNLLDIGPDGYMQPVKIINISDGNRNGLPEVFIRMGVYSQGGQSYALYEYAQGVFHSLVRPGPGGSFADIYVQATGNISIYDIDGDGLSEIYNYVGIPVWSTYYEGIPWRKEWDTYRWDGEYYTLSRRDFAAPEYRFQAAYDGDNFSHRGEYDKAFDSYQRVILSDGLQWYSPARAQYIWDAFMSNIGGNPLPTLQSPDPDEYPNLAAYAHYRMMLVKVLQGSMMDAEYELKALQKKYPEGTPGEIFARVAQIFWEEYHLSGNIGQSCSRVIKLVEDNQVEVFKYLGIDGYMGMYLPRYTPLDICPFE
jgi:hypothetical protein